MLFVLAIVLIVAAVELVVYVALRGQPGGSLVTWLVAAGVVTLAIIGGGTLSKLAQLRTGGAAVALSAGALAVDPTTSDPQLRRYVNVVEEMAIASGVAMPQLFVLPSEPGINAFAAGYTPADAAVCVTGGALQTLTRDELQGVLGHEFSHVLNGDMRINIRLLGALAGLLLLGLVGLRFLQFGGAGRSRRDSKDNAAGLLLFIAIAFVVLGFIGRFFAGLIQAAVSRQREWLADASSVQFTRQTSGLVGALRKIAGLPAGSALQDTRNATELSHMMFGEARRRLSGLYATHPPLPERIAALDRSVTPEVLEQQLAALPAAVPDGPDAAAAGFAPRRESVAITPGQVTASVGQLSEPAWQRGRRLSADVPDELRRLAQQPSTALPLVLALLIDPNPEVAAVQWPAIGRRLSAAVREATEPLAGSVRGLPAGLRLPLVGLAAPQLAARPAADRAAILGVLDELAAADNRMLPFEYCLLRVVGSYLEDASDPRRRSRPGRGGIGDSVDAALVLLAVVAASGNPDPTAAARAYASAASMIVPGRAVPFAPPPDPWVALDAAWPALDRLDPRDKRTLVEALVVAVRDDGVVTMVEAELLRTACAVLHVPVPALIG